MTSSPFPRSLTPFVVATALAAATGACLSDYGSDCDRNVDLACFWETRGGNTGGDGGAGGTGGTTTTTTALPVCGNATPETGEACDDGNTDDCDGCRGDCSATETGCGDGFLCGDEECDDGTISGGDGCAECKPECVGGVLDGTTNKAVTFADLTTFHCYARVSASPKSWVGARNQCDLWGGDLVAFGDLDELAAVTAALPGQTTAWTGGRGKVSADMFTWTNGEPWPADAPWADGQPDSTTDECVELTPAAELDDANCSKLSAFLCERDMAAAAP